MAQFHKLTVKEIKRETSKAVSIKLSVPEALQDIFAFKAGQYLTLKTMVNGSEVRRDYSICTNPDSKELRIVVKEVENGIFSTYANRHLEEGDTIEVAPPNGRFIFEPEDNKSRTIAAFAAGSGITPVMGILKTVLLQEPLSRFILTYGNKTPEDTIFFNDLIALQNEFPNRLTVQFVYSQCNEEDALFGRIERPVVNYVLKTKCNDATVDAFYLCGPETMIKTATLALTENGVPENNIRYELFTPSTEDTDSSEVTAREGETEVTVLVDDEETVFTMPHKKTVLQAALDEDIDAPYSCQGGICSSCIAKLTEGKVTMVKNNILTDSELEQGYILTCQSHPTTPSIYVDYDDV